MSLPGGRAPDLYLQEADCQIRRSSNGGRTWDALDGWECPFAFGPDGKKVFSGGSEASRSSDGGLTPEGLALPVPGSWGTLVAHPSIDGRLFVLYGREDPPFVYVSDDQGATWHRSSGIDTICCGRLFFGVDQPQRVYAIGDLDTFRSADGGDTWNRCGPTDTWHSPGSARLVVNPSNADHLLLATRGDGVLVSQDGCDSWFPSNEGLGNLFVSALVMNTDDPDVLYAGTDGGAYASFDGGDTWGEINDGLLGATVVYSIVVDPQGQAYAATPYGVFALEKR